MKIILVLVVPSILLANTAFGQNQENAFALLMSAWKVNNVNVCWENPMPGNEKERRLTKEAVSETWQKHSNLKFSNWGKCTSTDQGIRILISDEQAHTKGLGTRIDGIRNGMVLNFTFNQWNFNCRNSLDYCIKGLAVHEFGHAIGFAHEHNRSDCHFCDKEPQGSNGDWYVSTCDPKSVMNYCNEDYNNNGLLSEGDVIGVQALYGKPSTSTGTPSPGLKKSMLTYTIRTLTKDEIPRKSNVTHQFQIFVSGSNQELNSIADVTYTLHPTFENRYLTSSDRDDKFGIGIRVWGQFTIYGKIRYKDGTQRNVQENLRFDQHEQDIRFLHTARKLTKAERRSGSTHELKLFVTGNVGEIESVTYHLHPTFNEPDVLIDTPEDNFELAIDVWGTFEAGATVKYKDGTTRELKRYLDF